MDIPKTLPANANETKYFSATAVTVSAAALVAITVVLRYLGRWLLHRRNALSNGKTERVYGLDDGTSNQ